MELSDLRFRHHAILERIVLFDYRLTCQSGLHIGAGKSADFAGSDLPVVRDASGRPFIPGSSLRGVLRAGIESCCLTLDLDKLLQRAPEISLADISKEFANGWKALGLAQRLFGAVEDKDKGVKISYGSRLQLSDATCENDALFEVRDGVSISRETRTAAKEQGGKFDVEVVPAGTKFSGRVRFKNPADYEVGLLAQALWMLSEGVLLLGGKSARGLGWVKVETTEPREISAADLLARKAGDGSQEFGAVENKLSRYLDRLQELADFAAAEAAS